MTEQKTKKRFEIPGAMQWAIAGVAGLTTGLVSAIKATHSEFRQKMLDYWMHDVSPTSRRGLAAAGTAQRTGLPKEALNREAGELYLHDQLSKHGILLENATTRQLNRNLLDMSPAERQKANWSYVLETHGLKDDAADALRNFYEKLGFESKGWRGLTKGSWQRYNFMGGETKTAIAFDAVLATLIGAGGALMFTKGFNTHNKLGKISDEQQTIRENQQKILDQLNAQQKAKG